jgi:hypothetical protein
MATLLYWRAPHMVPDSLRASRAPLVADVADVAAALRLRDCLLRAGAPAARARTLRALRAHQRFVIWARHDPVARARARARDEIARAPLATAGLPLRTPRVQRAIVIEPVHAAPQAPAAPRPIPAQAPAPQGAPPGGGGGGGREAVGARSRARVRGGRAQGLRTHEAYVAGVMGIRFVRATHGLPPPPIAPAPRTAAALSQRSARGAGRGGAGRGGRHGGIPRQLSRLPCRRPLRRRSLQVRRRLPARAAANKEVLHGAPPCFSSGGETLRFSVFT